MENSTDALKMVFAIFMFLIALSIVFSLLSKVKETADTVLWYSDKTNYYEWVSGTTEKGRKVGVDTVISTLKNYRAQSVFVIIEDISGAKEQFNYSVGMDDKINTFIKNNINSSAEYLENIIEINTSGKYKIGDDGTRTTIQPGDTRTFIIYKKQS